jgi:hypothetical protein
MAERMKDTFTKRMAPLLQVMPTETFRGCFGTHDHQAIWEELNTSQDHRERAIEWLDAVMATCVGTELKGENARAHALRVQDAYRTSKSSAMKRYIEKEQSPQCQIDTEAITAHFGQSWSVAIEEFREARDGSEFELEQKIGDQQGDDLQAYILGGKKTKTVINSRQDLSACGVDGTSHRLIKSAKEEGVKVIRIVVEACVRNGRVLES